MKTLSTTMKAERFGTPTPRHLAYAKAKDGNSYSLWRWAAGVGSEFIYYLPALVFKYGKLRVVLYVRVSSQRQAAGGKLLRKVQYLRRKVEALGCQIVGVFFEVSHSSVYFVSDKKAEGYTHNRWEFEKAVDCARDNNAVLVAASRDRFLRGRYLHNNRYEAPAVGEYVRFHWLTAGVTLATLVRPDASGRPTQTKLGMEVTDAKLGRPTKATRGPGRIKCRREIHLPEVLKLRAKDWSYRRIAAHVNVHCGGWQPVTPKTIWNWVSGAGKAV